MNQREQLKNLVIDFCNKEGSRTFALKKLNAIYGDYQNIGIGGKTPQATVRRLLQELRDSEFLSFLDKSGHYTLRGVDFLETEKEELQAVDISKETPQRKEYLLETYVRKTKWAKMARNLFGDYCLCHSCNNTFLKEDGTRYIEVHHIIPLHCGGEDGIWNLSVLCAHHHRMAHFANAKDRIELENFLLKEVRCRV